MEDNTVEQPSKSESTESPRSDVGFPEITRRKKGGYGVLVLIGLALIIAAFFVYSMFFGGEASESLMKDITPTPVEQETNSEEPAPEPTVVQAAKKDLKVAILNGSGIPGSAGELKKVVEALGFLGITTGNASSYDYKATEVTFSDKVSDTIKAEVVAALKKAYDSVESKDGKTDDVDIQIIIGPKVSASSPSPTTRVSPTTTPSPTSTN